MKRLALISGIEMGGLKTLDIQSMICAKRIICLKKLLEDYSSPAKVILVKFLLPIGGRFVLHCNFQTSKLKINLPAFYKECFDAWSEVNGLQVVTKTLLMKLSGTTNFFVMTKSRCTEEI